MKNISIIFFIKKDKQNARGESAIYVKLKVFKTETTFSTQRWILHNRWTETKKLSITRNVEEIKIRTEFGNISRKLQDMFQAQLTTGTIPSALTLKDNYLNPVSLSTRTLQGLIKFHREIFDKKVASDQRTLASSNKYNTVAWHINNFLKFQYSAVDIDLPHLNFDFIQKFDFYLRMERNCCNNTTVKYAQFLRSIISTGIKHEWLSKDPFLRYEGKLEEVKTNYLTNEQLKRIEEKDFKNERLNIIRDTFLFACYTGFAPCDVGRLTHSDVVKHIDGKTWIRKARIKTSVVAEVPLLPPVISIIEKYKNHPKCIVKNLLLPFNSNSTLNAYLQEIGDLCRIPFDLHFYCARHTFATTVTMSNGVSMEAVSAMLGHKRISQTQVYSKIVDTKIGKEMDKVFNLYRSDNESDMSVSK